jgi:carbohydrate kinase (thermoresistant glucokinase family)
MTILVLMGVSGSGKTTIAERLAQRLGWQFQEGDALHPPATVAKMASGTPLTDADRGPWLHAIAALIDKWRASGQDGIVTCSALKRSYRRILIDDRPELRLVYLQADKSLLAERLAKRRGHFMPASLLDSQLATLEEPGPDEHPIIAHVGPSPETIVNEIIRQMG